ncbi:MAG: LysM peptidoglycan-binding domain-containing protein [Bacteroidia bacterium]
MRTCLILLFNLTVFLNVHSSPPDSLGLKVVNGKEYIIHEVQAAEGYFAISRIYNVPVAAIRDANPDLGEVIPLGAIVFVPVMKNQEKSEAKELLPIGAIEHVVAEEETLYSISRNYKVAVEQLKSWNALSSDTIHLGQRLYLFPEEGRILVPIAMDSADTAIPSIPRAPLIVKGDNDYEEVHGAIQSAAREEKEFQGHYWTRVEENAIAGWIDDGSLISNKFLALHASAPAGTVLQVTNLMNGRSAFVKVVGGLPNSEVNTRVKLTKSLIKKLGVIDEYFRVEIEYGIEK